MSNNFLIALAMVLVALLLLAIIAVLTGYNLRFYMVTLEKSKDSNIVNSSE